MLTPEEFSKLQLYKGRILDGEQLPIEEQREALMLLRENRQSVNNRPAKSKGKKAPPRDASALLAGLGIKLGGK